MNMNSLSLVLFSLLMSISAQADTLNLEQLEAIAKNTAEYKAFKNLEDRFTIHAKIIMSEQKKCKDNKECIKSKMFNASAEAANKMFEAQEVWWATLEYQAWNKAKTNRS